jgi:hypothetical protein
MKLSGSVAPAKDVEGQAIPGLATRGDAWFAGGSE